MSRPLPLDGVTVVDLGQIYNGPYCSFLLAMAGARVIKIESPGGEHLRRRSVVGGAAVPFAMLNSNKNFALSLVWMLTDTNSCSLGITKSASIDFFRRTIRKKSLPNW